MPCPQINEVELSMTVSKMGQLVNFVANAGSPGESVSLIDRPIEFRRPNKHGPKSNDLLMEAGTLIISLRFVDDELPMHVAGNGPQTIADWFCLQRPMLIRAVAREELNRVLMRNWREAPASQNEWRVPALAFQIMVSSNSASSSLSRSNNYAALTESVIQDCIAHVARDTDCSKYRMLPETRTVQNIAGTYTKTRCPATM